MALHSSSNLPELISVMLSDFEHFWIHILIEWSFIRGILNAGLFWVGGSQVNLNNIKKFLFCRSSHDLE